VAAILIASADDALRASFLLPLAREGFPARSVAGWDPLCQHLCDPETRLVLVDPDLPGLDAGLLFALASSLTHRPRVRTVGGERPPLARLPATPRAALRQARSLLGPSGLTPTERRDLRWLGLGVDPVPRLVAAVGTHLPILVHGERGTGKERLGRVLHRLAHADARRESFPPMVVLPPGSRWERSAGPGTLYLESVHRRDTAETRSIVRDAGALQWRVLAGSRAGEAPAGVDWVRISLPPLRERPNELPALAAHYLELHAARLGVGRRTLDRALMAELHAWRWPGNQRELEAFLLQAVGELPGPTLRGRDLTEALRALLRPAEAANAERVGSFEDAAEERLRPVVASYAPGPGPTLHELVIASAERVLLNLVLTRTGGNRKAAAALLGIARNTLLTRIKELGLANVAEDRGRD